MSEPFDLSILYGEYRDEAGEHLARLDAALLAIERDGGLAEAQHAELLRALHTLKGNSGMLGFAAVRDYVHDLEEVLRIPPAQWTQPAVDRLFEGAALLRAAAEQAGTESQADAFERLAAHSPAAAESARTPLIAPEPTTPEAPTPEAPDPATAAQPADELLRIPLSKLNSLLNEVGGLIQLGAALEEFAYLERAALGKAGLLRPLQHQLEVLDRATDALRSSALELRLVPVRRSFQRFPSLVRDLAHEQNKQIRVVLEGEDTEIDKSTVDALAEPLLHLVRNAVDHGIRTPEERRAAGKDAEGTIILRATRVGDRVRIEVEDDGSGLDRAAILARAQAAGMLSANEVAPLAPEQIDDLIFRPGFSTRSETTAISGRGIGLDVVRESVRRLRGSLRVEDLEGGGTRFSLELPLTLAIVSTVLFQAGDTTLGIAATEIEETVRVGRAERLGPADVIRHRGELIPLARPDRLFGWADATPAAAPAPFALIVRRGARSAAITADRLLDQRDVVVHGLPAYVGTTPAVAGTTVSPDGRVILLLNTAELIDLNAAFYRRQTRAGVP